METKESTIKHLTDLMVTIQMAYYKGRLGVRNGDDTGGDGAVCGELWVHETGNNEAAISIDLYNFGGDGLPVCEGLNPCTITFDDGTTDTGWLYNMFYIPDDVTPLAFNFTPNNGPDIDVKPDSLPEGVLRNITAWIEGVFQHMPVMLNDK